MFVVGYFFVGHFHLSKRSCMHGAKKEKKGRKLLLQIVAFALSAQEKGMGWLLLHPPELSGNKSLVTMRW